MDLLVHQLILASRRSDDTSGWSELVVFLILAVFWAVSGIVKARGEKEKQQKKQQQQTETVRPLKSTQKPILQRYQVQRKPAPQQAKPAIRPIVREPGAGSKPIVRSRPAVSKPAEHPKPIFKEQKAYKAAPKDKISFSQKSEQAAQTAALDIPIKPLAALDSPEELQTAILHYEILGQCIALRESEDKVWQR